eukprot:373868_1
MSFKDDPFASQQPIAASAESERSQSLAERNVDCDREEEDEDELNNLKFSLAHYFSTIFVVFIVLLITATILFFVWSNTSDGAWVSLQVRPVLPDNWDSTPIAIKKELFHKLSSFMDDDEIKSMENIQDMEVNINIFQFSLVSAVSDFWQAKAYGLAILIAAFSGVWPYIKLFMLMVCWLQPMKQENREAVIIFLDQMG